MITSAAPADDSGERGLRRGAPHPRLPSLEKDNCIRNGRHRSVFVAQENLRLFIWKFGEPNIGVLTVTLADCIEASEFQRKWHSFINRLRRLFASGMWIRERQPRSGNWHAHAVVNVGWDIKTNFPFDQVRKGFYANVDPTLRAIWKQLREAAESHGFGRIELLPLKHSGPACARYLTKYLAKAFGSEKALGEEKGRLFGVWGRVRFVYSRFSFLSSRIVQKRKEWLIKDLGFADTTELTKSLPHWWFHLGKALSDVIMPIEYYQVRQNGALVFDEFGFQEYQRNLQRYDFLESESDRITASHYQLYLTYEEKILGRNPVEATQNAMRRIGYKIPASTGAEGQLVQRAVVTEELLLNLQNAIERTKQTVPT